MAFGTSTLAIAQALHDNGDGGRLISRRSQPDGAVEANRRLQRRARRACGSPRAARAARRPRPPRPARQAHRGPVRVCRRLAHLRLHAVGLLLHRQDAQCGWNRRVQRLRARRRSPGDASSCDRTAATSRTMPAFARATSDATSSRRWLGSRPGDRSQIATSARRRRGNRRGTSTPASDPSSCPSTTEIERSTARSPRFGDGRRARCSVAGTGRETLLESWSASWKLGELVRRAR